jgi:hypothetical protein
LGLASSGKTFQIIVNAAAATDYTADTYNRLITAGGNKDEFSKLSSCVPPGVHPKAVLDMKNELESMLAAEISYQNSALSKVTVACMSPLMADLTKHTGKLSAVAGGLGAAGDSWKAGVKEKLAGEQGPVDMSTPVLKDALSDFGKQCYSDAIKKRFSVLVEVRVRNTCSNVLFLWHIG